MKIHRFIDDFNLSKKELEIKGEIAHQITKVLKLRTGEKIELCDGKGIYAIAEIEKIVGKNVFVKIENLIKENKIKQKNNITLFCTILKKENFEIIVQKTTECGVSKIVPIISERTIKTGLNIERLKKIAKEASEQSMRSDIPEILEPITFEESLKLVDENNLNILFDKSGDKYQDVSNNKSPSFINIWIGPEGGWTEKEINKAKNFDFKIFSLGPLTLRGETAAIVATYLVSNS